MLTGVGWTRGYAATESIPKEEEEDTSNRKEGTDTVAEEKTGKFTRSNSGRPTATLAFPTHQPKESGSS